MIRKAAIMAMLAFAACAGDAGSVEDQCSTSLAVNPSSPVVGQVVTITANITGNLGQPTIDWRVRFNQADIIFDRNGEQEISFTPADAGVYTIDMVPSSSGSLCPSRQEDITVTTGGVGEVDVRLRVTPPIDLGVPPIDRVISLPRGTPAYSLGVVSLEPGRTTNGTVGRAAYMRFIPDGQPDAVVEAYADATGAFAAKVQSAPHHILIVPDDPAYPPQVVDPAIPGQDESFTLSTGVAITGTVRRPNGTALAGAKVQVFMTDPNGITVPSTIGTSAANGTFTLRAFAANGAEERVVVTPPAGSGLPRLDAGSQNFDFTNAIEVNYSSALVLRDVSGTDVVRSGALANAKVTIVGTIPFATAGSIVAGTTAVSNGYVRIPMTADANGVLPSVLVPAADLYAVVEPANAPGDSAVVAFDTTSTVPGTIDAPPMVTVAPLVRLDQTPIGGVKVELVPAGVLAFAGVGPTVLYSDENGVVSGSLASGAIYEARITDPSRRAGPAAYSMVDSTLLSTTLETILLSEPLTITGTLSLQGSPNRVEGAAVQVLCQLELSSFECTGLERERPLGEDASDAQGAFTLVVPRPGIPI